ncbi:SAM-dependent methyltransferase [Streptomyces rochei]|uniref:SAM-dependent methyltransferase n=1 Tax=Streptomyces rochei TaxID=1928 RepID=UPI0038076BF9
MPDDTRRTIPAEATMSAEDTNTRAWHIYGQRQLARAYTPPVPARLGWTPWEGIGPGAEVLGEITGRRVLDIGSGAGHHAVHLAQAHGALVTGIELSPTQHERAVSAHAGVPDVEFVQADVTEYLAETERKGQRGAGAQAVAQCRQRAVWVDEGERPDRVRGVERLGGRRPVPTPRRERHGHPAAQLLRARRLPDRPVQAR